MKGYCEGCGMEIEVIMCCDGRQCGCMGLPVEPPVCSDECWDIYMKKLKLEKNEDTKDFKKPAVPGIQK